MLSRLLEGLGKSIFAWKEVKSKPDCTSKLFEEEEG
jgi:hypothetical protein